MGTRRLRVHLNYKSSKKASNFKKNLKREHSESSEYSESSEHSESTN